MSQYMKKGIMMSLIVASLAIISCKNAILRMAGMRAPQIESPESINKFLLKIGQDTNSVYALDTTLYENLKHEAFKEGISKGFRPIQIRMYDNTGMAIMQWVSCEGFLKDLKLFDTLPPRVINGVNRTLTLQQDLERYYTLDGKPAHLVPPPGYDYYILIYFGKFFPKHSKESFRQVDAYCKTYSSKRFKIYKIDVDFLEFWGAELHTSVDAHIGGEHKSK